MYGRRCEIFICENIPVSLSLNADIFVFLSCIAIIPMTWANVTPDTGRLLVDSRLSDMRRAAIRCAGASRWHGGQVLLLNCEKDSHTSVIDRAFYRSN